MSPCSVTHRLVRLRYHGIQLTSFYDFALDLQKCDIFRDNCDLKISNLPKPTSKAGETKFRWFRGYKQVFFLVKPLIYQEQ
jgi:hypothetical protein